MTDFEKCSHGDHEIEYLVERTEGQYERNRMKLNSNVFLQGHPYEEFLL